MGLYQFPQTGSSRSGPKMLTRPKGRNHNSEYAVLATSAGNSENCCPAIGVCARLRPEFDSYLWRENPRVRSGT
jgi:hypothetical protein